MIPAKISNPNPVQVTYYKLSEPDPDDYITGYDYEHNEYISDDLRYNSDMEAYEASKVIADVENVTEIGKSICLSMPNIIKWAGPPYFNSKDCIKELSLNQQLFIELTGEGKVKIVKL